jgi:hypothetical protein
LILEQASVRHLTKGSSALCGAFATGSYAGPFQTFTASELMSGSANRSTNGRFRLICASVANGCFGPLCSE